MKCPNCSAELLPGVKFCDQCGFSLLTAPPVETPQTPPEQQFGSTPPMQTPQTPPMQQFGSTPPMQTPQPPVYSPPLGQAVGGSDKSGLAIASLVVGALSLCAALVPICGIPAALAGAVLGFLGLGSSQRTMAIIGIVLCALGLILSILNAAFSFFMLLGNSTPSYY